MRDTHIDISTAALTHNLRQVKQRAPNSRVLAMLKADAYGHGMALCLAGVAEADAIGLACLAEAERARVLGWQKPMVLIEGVFAAEEWPRATALGCQLVVHNDQQLMWALRFAPNRPDASTDTNTVTDRPTVWLKFNSGMNRLGFTADACMHAAQRLHAAGYRLVLTSHFANADVPEHPSNRQQSQRFADLLAQLRAVVDTPVAASLCNSAALCGAVAPSYDWVRPGIMLYGGSPLTGVNAQALHLQPVMHLWAQIMAKHDMPVGQAVGYGSTYITQHACQLAVVSIGYGDGYPRSVDTQTTVLVHDPISQTSYRCPIRGRVSMDMLIIELVDGAASLPLGAPVTLWGKGLPIEALAEHANSINYELFCRLTQRPYRQAVD